MRWRVAAAFGKLGLFARTATHLRADQIAHLVYRRVRPSSRSHGQRDRVRMRRRRTAAPAFILGGEAQPGDTLSFIGRERSIANGIDWRAPEMSRLWRYHLHYFDYLRDRLRTTAWKRAAIADWIAHNPHGTRDAWEPYPTSLRIVNWIKFFDELTAAFEDVDEAWLQSLYRQVLWLERNLERHVLANHYLKNAKALLFAGIFFEGSDADRWRKRGLRIFQSQIAEQFLDDGGHYERSPMYHIICLEDLLDTLQIISNEDALVGVGAVRNIRTHACKALDFLDAILMPDGDIPLFNDAAFGMTSTPRDVFECARQLIGYQRPERSAGTASVALASSGYYVIRDGDDALVIDCGEPGPSYQPGHAHCDVLSYELAISGRRLIVDSGVYDYEAGETRRNVRSTAAHNTVSVDGREQSEIWGVFRVGRRARPIAAAMSNDPALGVRFVGAYDGFRGAGKGVVHRRTVSYADRRWSFEDTIEGSGVHLIESRIHLAPGLDAWRTNATIQVTDEQGCSRARIVLDRSAAAKIERSEYHPRFGVTEHRPVIVLSRTARLPMTLRYRVEAAAQA